MVKILILVALLIVNTAYGSEIDTLLTKSKITNVTVFFSGAQITRNANIKLSKGKHLLLIDKLPQEINSQSIQVEKISNCKILSVKYELKFQNGAKKNADILAIETKIKNLELKIKEIKNKIEVFDLEEKLLLDNSLLSKKNDGSAINDIKLAADYYRNRLNEIRQGKLTSISDADLINDEIQKLNSQLNVINSKDYKTYSQIFVTIDCEKEITTDLKFKYYVSSAGWQPLYDFRVDDITKPLSIVYNADVFQSTSEDWKNVNIKLSTNNPSLSGNKPELSTWYIDRKNSNVNKQISNGISTLKGTILDNETNEAIPFAYIKVMNGNETITEGMSDFDGNYTIKPINSGRYIVKVSSIGYNTTQTSDVYLTSDEVVYLDFKLNSSVINLEEVQVSTYKKPLISRDESSSGGTVSSESIAKMSGRSATTVAGVYSKSKPLYNLRGSRSEGSTAYIDGIKANNNIVSTNYISNTLKTTVTNLEYSIEIPYTIPSDGENYSLKIKEVSLPVNYIYHAVPKLDNDAFLTAEITDWSQLNLLSGKSSIYYQGTFTGESFIDVNQANDTLNISLGRDKNIFVKRDGNKELFDKRVIGNYIKETIAWDITVKNNKDNKIKIIIEDQFPVSEKKSIEIEQLESSNAKLDAKTSKLNWTLELEPNEKKVLQYKYSVKYPKFSNLIIE